jgi:hypothetical protein
MRALFLLLLISGAALADDAGLLRCRGIPDAAKRLACYDALVVAPPEARPAPGQSQPAAAASGVSQQTPEQFGIERRPPKTELEAIESRIPGHFEGWDAKSRITLANGQVWQIADDSNQYFYVDNPKVTIRRGLLGAYYLEVEGSNATARVRRVK